MEHNYAKGSIMRLVLRPLIGLFLVSFSLLFSACGDGGYEDDQKSNIPIHCPGPDFIGPKLPECY